MLLALETRLPEQIGLLLQDISFPDLFEMLQCIITLFYGIGIVLTAVFCVLSKLLSNKYAVMLGKE